jgi:hypothetical protein
MRSVRWKSLGAMLTRREGLASAGVGGFVATLRGAGSAGGMVFQGLAALVPGLFSYSPSGR